MFKGLFAKYMAAFTLIILISFSLVIGIIAAIVGRHSEQAKKQIMQTTAEVSVTFVQGKIEGARGASLRELIAAEADDMIGMLSIANANDEDMTLLVTDADGNILLEVGKEQSDLLNGARIPDDMMRSVSSEPVFFEDARMKNVFEKPHAVCALACYDASGTLYGHVFVCSDSMMMSALVDVMVKAIVIAILWVLLAALVAVYLISDRVTSPLKEMSRAAKAYAAGRFDTRVPVRGHDEIAELAVAFNSMAEAMDNYDTMRNAFMSNISHDLRSPMTSISGFIDGILDGVIPPEKHRYYLQIVSTEVHRLSRLVASLLDLSRIQAGERKFSMSPFDVCEMGREILISFEQKINERRLEVDFYCDEERMSVLADRDAIYQILYNLCDNAIKFSSEGGLLQLRIEHQKNRKVAISVYNEGQGIASSDLPYVFERFYKSDKSRGLNKTGVGLGLFIAKTIIDAHGESIWVESEFGKNCCFCFTLTGE